LLRSLQ
jgi:hypothetical protein